MIPVGALVHDSSREIVTGFLDETIRRFGWWGAQAWWAESPDLVAEPWRIGGAAPRRAAEYFTLSAGGAFCSEGHARFLSPTQLTVHATPWLGDAAEELARVGATDLVVFDVPGMFDLDVRLVFVLPAGEPLNPDVIEYLESGARLMPTVIRHEKERIDLTHGATHDPLTGLLNRRGLEQALANEGASTSLRALVFLDLDEYKEVNDTHGHQVGDEVLVDVAAQLAAQIRPADSLARIGGDEFVMIANPVSSAEGAFIVAQRLLLAVSRDLISSTGATVSIAASVGVAIWHPGQEMGEVLRAADRLMYEAKRFGGGIATDDGTGRIVISDAYSDAHEGAAIGSSHQPVAVEVVRSTDGLSTWGHIVSLSGELSGRTTATIVAMIGDALRGCGGVSVDTILVVEISGLGWSRGDQLARLVAGLLVGRRADRLNLLLGATSSSESMRLALAEVRARFGVGVVMTCAGTASTPLARVESDRPRALVLASEIVESLDSAPARDTLVRMVAAVAQVLGVPVIARGTASPAATALLLSAGCELLSRATATPTYASITATPTPELTS